MEFYLQRIESKSMLMCAKYVHLSILKLCVQVLLDSQFVRCVSSISFISELCLGNTSRYKNMCAYVAFHFVILSCMHTVNRKRIWRLCTRCGKHSKSQPFSVGNIVAILE